MAREVVSLTPEHTSNQIKDMCRHAESLVLSSAIRHAMEWCRSKSEVVMDALMPVELDSAARGLAIKFIDEACQEMLPESITAELRSLLRQAMTSRMNKFRKENSTEVLPLSPRPASTDSLALVVSVTLIID